MSLYDGCTNYRFLCIEQAAFIKYENITSFIIIHHHPYIYPIIQYTHIHTYPAKLPSSIHPSIHPSILTLTYQPTSSPRSSLNSTPNSLRIPKHVLRIHHLLDPHQLRIRRLIVIQLMRLRRRQTRIHIIQVRPESRPWHRTRDGVV